MSKEVQLMNRRILPFAAVTTTLVMLYLTTFSRHPNLWSFRSSGLHMPLEGLHWLESNVPVAAAVWVLLVSTAFAVWHLRCLFLKYEFDQEWHHALSLLGFWCVTSGAVGLGIQLLTTEKRLVFDYFPAFVLIGAGVGFQVRSHIPSLFLVVLLYFSAATHKLFNFSDMQRYIPETISARIPDGLIQLAPDLISRIPVILSVIVVPLEYSMAILLLFKRTRRWGFFGAVIFHTLVATITNNADSLAFVGMYVLLGHACQFTFADEQIWQAKPAELGRQDILVLILAGVLTVGAAVVTRSGSGPDFLVGLNYAVLFFSLIVAVSLISSSTRPESFVLLAHAMPWKSKIWILVLVLWGVYPALIGYRNQQFGWAMMSGASSRKPVSCMVVDTNQCVGKLDLRPIAAMDVGPKLTVIATRQPAYFEKIQNYVETVCQSRVHFFGEDNGARQVKCSND